MPSSVTMTLVETSLCEDDDDDCIPSSQTQHSFSLARSPYTDPKLLRVKIPESPEEKLVDISTVQVDNDIPVEDSVEDDKENECCNSPIAHADGIATTISTPAESVTRRRRGSANWLSTESTSSPKPPRLSLSVSKEKKKNENAVKQGEAKKTTTKRKRKSQSSKTTHRKKSRSISSKEELNESTDQQDLLATHEGEKESKSDHEDSKPVQRYNAEIHEKDISCYFTKCKDTSSEKKIEVFPEKTENVTDLVEVIDTKVADEEDGKAQCAAAVLPPTGTETPISASADQPSEVQINESSESFLAAETKEPDSAINNDEAQVEGVIERSGEREMEINDELKTCSSAVTISQQLTVSSCIASVSQSSACSSPVSSTAAAVSCVGSTVQGSPKAFACLPSPLASPASILKKRSFCQSPSPPLKNRRVSFQLPEGVVALKDDVVEGAQDKDKSPAASGRMMKQKSKKADAPCVYPDLVQCTTPIEKILPSITLSRGVGHLVRAQNILTIGDLSSLSETQVENLPIRSPKVRTVKNALKTYSSQLSRQKSLLKSPLSMKDFSSPLKDGGRGAEALLGTPSKHGDFIKPTSLFSVFGKSVKEELKSLLTVQPKQEPESPLITAKLQPKCPQLFALESDVTEVSTCVNTVVLDEENPLPLKSEEILNDSFLSNKISDTASSSKTVQTSNVTTVLHSNTCAEEDVNEDIPAVQCEDIAAECEDIPAAECEDIPAVQCEDIPTVQCEDIPAVQCEDIPTVQCEDIPAVQCEDIPAAECEDVPTVQCEDVPTTETGDMAPMDEMDDEVIYSTPTHGDETETELEIDQEDLISNNKESNVELMDCTDEIRTILEQVAEKGSEILSNLSRLREEEQSSHERAKPLEDVARVDDSFESAFAAGNISPIKNNNESSFFETSSIDASDRDEEERHKLQNDEDEVSNVSADIPAIEGITPLANESDLNETSLNGEGAGRAELQTSIVCVPSSIVSTSTIVVDESTVKTSSTSSEDGPTVLDADATVVPDICSSLDQGTFLANPISNDPDITAPCNRTKNVQSSHRSVLPHIDIANLPTHDIFEFVGELENLKTAIMSELRTRMLGSHGKST